MNKIIITSDLSEKKEIVFDFGFKLAKHMNASVELVTIINQNVEYMPADIGMNFVDQWEAREHMARTVLEKVKEEHPEIPIEVVVFVGDPKEDVIKQAIETKACILVVGTHGRTGITHTLMGSTAEYIVRHSPIPVLVVPMKDYLH